LPAQKKAIPDMRRYFSQAKNLTPEAKEELQWTFERLFERLDWLHQFKGQP
jgi:hypothetical protein